ncbi:Peptidoglycan-binding lysm domain-containing protein [Thalictrum thalictroides]|uniref:Peptidoglycan-binding lysm domain-containing protein n=1 Tax=Thalictrum thalictroides TaxID=46969 RepID=A0A7J6UZR8_THATH|nr:Peptidoglycan-binding lysm domain-containing protein [Thalictrum thalictroides]
MQIDRIRHNGRIYSADHLLDLETPRLKDRIRSMSSSPSLDSISGNGGVGGSGKFIEHIVTKMDTLAGVAIKYGVEVADIKRMNGLVTDLQMFALKSLQIPLPGRHPPSPILSNGSATPGENSIDQNQSRRARSDVLESLQSLKLESPQRTVSPAMSNLQGYYRLKQQNHIDEGTEMAVYSTGRAHYLEDGPFPEHSYSEPPPSRHRKSRSLVSNILSDCGELAEDVPVAEVGDSEAEKLKKSVRRRQKADTDNSSPHVTIKEDNGGGSGFSATTGKGLALRPKSTNRIALAADADAGWLNPVVVGLGESLATNFFDGVRKSSSTSNLQEQEGNGSSIWTTSKWSLKPDLQAFSAASLARPIFDGLPKPMSGRKSKAALD